MSSSSDRATSTRPIRAGVFATMAAADRAVESLLGAGFPKDAISVVCSADAELDVEGVRRVDEAGAHTKEAAAAGGSVGAVLGGLVTAGGAVASGGTGLLLVGPLLGGFLAGGVAGGFVGAMSTRGLEPEIADYYDQSIRDGKVLVAVDLASEEDEPSARTAERVLREAGADPVGLPEG